MKKYQELSLPKKFANFLLNEEFNLTKRKTKSESPFSVTSSDSPISNSEKVTKESLDVNNTPNISEQMKKNEHRPFLLESKFECNPFLSNIKKNYNCSMEIEKGRIASSFVKLSNRMTFDKSKSIFLENDFDSEIDFNDDYTDFFTNAFLHADIIYNEGILNTFSSSKNPLNVKKSEADEKSSKPKNIFNNANNNNKEEVKEKENENTKKNINNNSNSANTLSEKEKIIINSLIALDKDYNRNEKDSQKNLDLNLKQFTFEEIYLQGNEKCSKQNSLEYDKRKNIFSIIETRINFYYDYYKKNKNNKINENQSEIKSFQEQIEYIINSGKNDESFLTFSFKSIFIGLNNLIINWLLNSHFKVYLNKIKDISYENNLNLDIFIELMDKYNTIKDICPFLEKDFKVIIDNFQKEKKMKFCLCELLTDFYWDCIFKIHLINKTFIDGYSSNNTKKNIIFEETKHSMKAIIDILIVYDTAYKKTLGEILDIPYIKKESIFLMSYIIKFKKSSNPFEIKNPCIDKYDEKSESKKKEKEKK